MEEILFRANTYKKEYWLNKSEISKINTRKDKTYSTLLDEIKVKKLIKKLEVIV
jgi:predicted  nucleic acid-binding Zn-ribbon protein